MAEDRHRRAYMRDAQVMILDEPTAALDARSEFEVFQRFKELSDNRTAVLISHRFSVSAWPTAQLVLDEAAWKRAARTSSLWPRGAQHRVGGATLAEHAFDDGRNSHRSWTWQAAGRTTTRRDGSEHLGRRTLVHRVALGIDYGTSNSTVGWLRPEQDGLLPLEDGKITLPSVVFFNLEERRPVYGRQASANTWKATKGV